MTNTARQRLISQISERDANPDLLAYAYFSGDLEIANIVLAHPSAPAHILRHAAMKAPAAVG